MKTLFLITARGGSKGIPGKNIKQLGDKPLIAYSIDIARKFVADEFICVSTDSDEIINVVENYGLKVPFKRPDELANDTSGSYEVILHAINWYKNIGITFKNIVLLQPTSPFRTKKNVEDALDLFSSNDLDMVVSVLKSKANPYYNLFEDDKNGYLLKSKTSNYTRRQDCPDVYQYNGAVYVFNVESLIKKNINQFTKVKKIIMSEEESLDIDTPLDWKIAEMILQFGN